MFNRGFSECRSLLLALAVSGVFVSAACGQYTVAPGSINFSGTPGKPLNSVFSGTVHNGPPVIYSRLNISGELFAVGASSVSSIDNFLRINGNVDLNLCCSPDASTSNSQFLDETTPGFYFVDPGDQFNFEAWTDKVTDPFDPVQGPIKSRIDNFQFEYRNEINQQGIAHLGNFAPGTFNFATVATQDPDDENASALDLWSELAVYTQANHAPVATTTSEFAGQYRNLSVPLGVGEYYLVVARARTTFSSDAIQSRLVFIEAGGGNFNVALNGDPLISGSLQQLSNVSFAPEIYTFTVAEPLLGDFNGDGIVNLADYTVWRNNLGAEDTVLSAGSTEDGSGFVDVGDYLTWKSSFGSGGSALTFASGAVAVPEPSLMAMLLPVVGYLGKRAAGRSCIRRE